MQQKFQLEEHADESRLTLFADVILPLAVENAYTYRIPYGMNEQAEVGKRVLVQFGKRKVYTALIVKIHEHPPKEYTAKYIMDILDEVPIINERQLEFWGWISRYYCCTLGEVMDAALPANMKLKSETKVAVDPEWTGDLMGLSDNETLIVEALQHANELTLGQVMELLDQKTVMPLLKGLMEKDVIVLQEQLKRGYRPKLISCVRISNRFSAPGKMQDAFQLIHNAPKQQEVLMALQVLVRKEPFVEKKVLLEKAKASEGPLQGLLEKGIVEVFQHEVGRLQAEVKSQKQFELTEKQAQALQEIKELLPEKKTVLLHGTTGSGKTHLYLKLAKEVMEQGKQVLYLVPEIALTAQLIHRLQEYFGEDVAVYHSRFSDNERVEIWRDLQEGKYRIILGPRSALFLPYRDLGLVVVDEEHENSYKQFDPAPRYNARDAAIFLAHLHGGYSLLGTATPAFESYHNAESGKYGLVKLQSRFTDIQYPEVVLSDLKQERKRGTMKSHFSSMMLNEMRDVLEAKEQIILFQNRRGYSPFLECQTCGWVPYCKNCDISLTYHKGINQLRCHYCGYNRDVPHRCQACGNASVKMKGFGTEKLEDELQLFFPEARILRLDQDSTRGKKSLQEIITTFERGEADILVGTQMVTKGLDFNNVRMVGIMSADQMLSFPDFRAYERSYQLMGQVSGRAGRRKKRGRVIIQTFKPEQAIFSFLGMDDYEGFFRQHIEERATYQYPPFFRLIRLVLKDKELAKIKQASELLAQGLRKHFGHRVLGPEFPPVIRIKNRYLMHILLKFEKSSKMKMPEAKQLLLQEVEAFRQHKDFKSVWVNVDVDPL